MQKPGRNRIFVIAFTTVLLLAVIVLSALPGSPLHYLTTPISVVISPIEKAFTRGIDEVSGFFQSLTDGQRIRRENEALKLENARLRNQISQLEDAGHQYNSLKNAFKLKDLYDQYDIVGARVLAREIGLWFGGFRIDVGTSGGFGGSGTESFAVVDAESNLIGRVASTDLLTGKVLPLLHEGFSVSARINRPDGALMRVRGSIDLKEEGYCLADQITVGARLNPGDLIVTSGLGGLFPAGIPIGTVVSVQETDTQTQRQATIEPFADFNQLTTVFVMKGIEP